VNGGLGGGVLFVATLASGLVAGLFFAYSVSVMRGLARARDGTFVEAMQQINVAILNGWFALAFLGAPLSTSLAVLLHLGSEDPVGMSLLLTSAGLSGATLAITFGVSVPLNNDLATATAAEAAVARRAFEARWVRWNLARTVTSTAAFGSLAGALLLSG
jgi:uncharacterized membrane protein